MSDKNVTKYFVTLVWMKHTPEGSVASGSTRAFVDTSTRLEALEQAKKFAADLRYKDKRMPPDATMQRQPSHMVEPILNGSVQVA